MSFERSASAAFVIWHAREYMPHALEEHDHDEGPYDIPCRPEEIIHIQSIALRIQPHAFQDKRKYEDSQDSHRLPFSRDDIGIDAEVYSDQDEEDVGEIDDHGN